MPDQCAAVSLRTMGRSVTISSFLPGEQLMMSVWSHRPSFWRLGLFFAAYVLGCAFARALQIVPGSTVSFWPPGGLFMATLIVTPMRSWPWWIAAGCVAEMFAQLVWFKSPLPAGFLVYVGNALEAMAGAWLVNRLCGRPVRLETLRDVLVFVAVGAGVAPVVGATIGSATLAWFGVKSQTFTGAWPLFWIGDATGILIVAPLALAVFQTWRNRAKLSAAHWIEIGILGVIFVGVAGLSFGGYVPFAFITMPLILWAAVRFEFKGAAVALVLLAVIATIFTVTGVSQFVGDVESQRQKQIMLHLFLAISALSALIVAAISRQHNSTLLTLRQKLETLHDRERQLRQLIDAVPAMIWSTTAQGSATYLNKRYTDVTGAALKDLFAADGSAVPLSVAHPDDLAASTEVRSRAFATGTPYVLRYRQIRRDGTYRWTESRGEPLRDDSGAIIQWYGVSVDIDDQVKAQEALRQREHELSQLVDDEMRAQESLRRSERELQQLVDALPVHVWGWTPDGKLAYVNKRSMEELGLFGANFEECAKVAQALVHPEDAPEVLRVSAHCLKTGDVFTLRYRRRWKDGTYRWIEGRCEPLRDRDGTIVHWYQVSLDIDDQVRAEEALRRSERQLQQLVDAVPVMIWSTTPEGRPSYVNKRFTDITGFTLDDIIAPDGSFNLSIIHPDDRVATAEAVGRSFTTGTPYVMKYRQLRRDGSSRWIETRAEALRDESGAVLQWYGVSVDIDEQVRLFSELEEREAKIRRLVDSDIIGIVIWDLDGRLIDANDAFLRMVQYERKDLQAGLGWLEMTPPEWQEVHAQEEAEELARTGKMQPREKEYFRKDGSRVPVLIGAACFEGQSRQGVAYILDLTEQKRAESALRDRERELAQLVDMLPVYIRRLTREGEPIFFNKRLTDFIGVGLPEIGAPGGSRLVPAIDNFVHPDEAANVTAALRRAVATGEPYVMRYRMRGANGAYRWIETRAEPLRNQDGTIVQWYSVSIDIEDEVRAQQAEEALRETSDRLAKATQAASLAELSASIAHEVNQPLAAIVANSHACHRWLSADPPNLERAKVTAERITRDANSAAEVVSHIRALFRQSPERRSETMLHDIIFEAHKLMAEEAQQRRIHMDLDVEPNLPLIAFDRVQIQQVLVNLVRNGMDAMDATSEDKVLGIRVRRIDDLIQAEIIDRGPGVKFPDKIFEPFFTTKEQGMGMGLPICRSIVESHGGRLWVEKNEPQGAKFIFTLPVEMKRAHADT
jgi:PAS domain S-box-containing protein